MRILWFTWKDRKNPLAGGAEFINEALASCLVKDGHEVIFIVAGFREGSREEIKDGYKIIRVGNKWSVYFQAYRYYKKNLKGWADLIIEEINTIPFMTQLYTKERKVLIVYQLCREIWFYQMFFPLNVIGYMIEPLYLWLLRKNTVVTISLSTKNEIITYGFTPRNISVIPIGIELEAVKDLRSIKKYSHFTILSLGAIREMKKTLHQIETFEIAKKQVPETQLKIAGNDYDHHYINKVLKLIQNSPYRKDIAYLGKVDKKKKIELIQKSHCIIVTSVKEGWGLIVTEANSQGTPAISYDVDGLRDSVKNKFTGLLCQENTPQNLAKNIIKLYRNKALYKKLQMNAWQWSKEMTFDRSYQEFLKIIAP